MTQNEKTLIGSSAVVPFRVLSVTNKQDSLILRTKCKDVDMVADAPYLSLLIERLKLTMEAESGVGIAAPQVGISRNVFLLTRIDKPEHPVEAIINPKIVLVPENTICFERDGCLSIPDVSGNSVRYPWVEVEYFNAKGEKIKEKLSGYSRKGDFTAVIFQHEFDHLNGVLFTDKLCNEPVNE